MGKLAEHLFSYSMIAVWLVIWALCQSFDLVSRFANKGAAIIGNEYYRYATSLMLHSNIVHVLFNGLQCFSYAVIWNHRSVLGNCWYFLR